MKIIKLLLPVLLIYFLFITVLFLFLNSPAYNESGETEVDIPVSFDQTKPTVLKVDNLYPDFDYKVFFYINKTADTKIEVFNNKKRKIFSSENKITETEPTFLENIHNQKSTSYILIETPLKNNDAYLNELEKLKTEFYQKIIADLKELDAAEIRKDFEVIQGVRPLYPGQERMTLKPIIIEPTHIKKLIARPEKNLKTWFTIQNIIINSYTSYLIKDKIFLILYIGLIFLTIWFLFKIKREIG